MAKETITFDSAAVLTWADDLADGGTLELAGTQSTTNTAEASAVAYGGDCTIEYVVENPQGTPVVEIELAAPTGSGLYPLATAVPTVANDRALLRVTNASGGPADFAILGYEVE